MTGMSGKWSVMVMKFRMRRLGKWRQTWRLLAPKRRKKTKQTKQSKTTQQQRWRPGCSALECFGFST
jgi:hypothetical protein